MFKTWGVGLFQNESAEIIKDYYLCMLKKGLSDDDAYNNSITKVNEFTYEEDKNNAIIGLIYTMWKYGRINDSVKNLFDEALNYENKRVWENEKKARQYIYFFLFKDFEKILVKVKESLNNINYIGHCIKLRAGKYFEASCA